MQENANSQVQALSQNNPERLFQTSWWLDIVCGVQQWKRMELPSTELKPVSIIIPDEKKWGFRFSRTPRLSPYLPPSRLITSKELKTYIQLLQSYDEWLIALSPEFNELIEGLEQENDFEIKKMRTFILSLNQTKEAIQAGLSRQRKRHIKNARKQLRFQNDQIELKHFILHHQKAFEGKGKTYPYDLEFLSKLIEEAQKNQAVFLRQAYYNNILIGQIACFYDQQTMYYLLGSFDREYASQNPMSVLMYDSILKAKELGLSTFDFEGSNDEGIARFFSEFGGDAVDYYVLSQINNPIWKLKKKWLG